MLKKASVLKFKNEGNIAEIMLYGIVDGSEISVKNIQEQLDAFSPDEIHLRINSAGGDVQEGIAIANLIKSYDVPTTAYIDSLCASIATVIAVSADKVIIASNAQFMIHLPVISLEDSMANADELRSSANALEAITKSIKQSYIDKGIKIDEKKLDELMKAETWLTAEEALEMGFVDEIGQKQNVKAYATRTMLNLYENVPDNLPTEPDEPSQEPKEPTQEGDKTLDELMNELFDTVDQIKKVYKQDNNQEPDTEPSKNPNTDPSKTPEQDPRIGNMFKAFLNTKI